MTKKLILASQSPRRQELLQQINIPFTVKSSNVDESSITTADPLEKVRQLAELKGKSIEISEDEVIISADTVVALQQEIFEKPRDEKHAYEMLATLSGKTHDVYTGVMIRSVNDEILFVERTEVEFWPLTDADIHWYLSTKEPFDKAGSYGIQGAGAVLVKKICGDYFNVVGLPISRVVQELKRFSIFPNKQSGWD